MLLFLPFNKDCNEDDPYLKQSLEYCLVNNIVWNAQVVESQQLNLGIIVTYLQLICLLDHDNNIWTISRVFMNFSIVFSLYLIIRISFQLKVTLCSKFFDLHFTWTRRSVITVCTLSILYYHFIKSIFLYKQFCSPTQR
jgi:hypothetical protein